MNTKKDYVRAAALVRRQQLAKAAWLARECFVVFFSEENPRFDVTRFREACEADK